MSLLWLLLEPLRHLPMCIHRVTMSIGRFGLAEAASHMNGP